MSKKKKGRYPVAPPKQEKKMVIDMNAMSLKKEHTVPGFRTGRHMTEKDRPRKKDWKREYERGREPGRYNNDTRSGSCYIRARINFPIFPHACLAWVTGRAVSNITSRNDSRCGG